jgi:hypothetical protein
VSALHHRRMLPPGDAAWWHPKQLMGKLVGLAVAALAGQIVVPAALPYMELWLYSLTGVSVTHPRFLVVASPQEMADAEKPTHTDPEFNRLFCGFSLSPAKYCVMHRLDAVNGKAPGLWRFDRSPTKAVLLGARSSEIQISWISQNSGSGGSAVAPNHVGGGSYAGYGFACAELKRGDQGTPMPIRVLIGDLPDDVRAAEQPPLDEVKASVLSAMQLSTTKLEISAPQACSAPRRVG